MARKLRSLEERFWEKVDKGPLPRGCWLWTAGKTYFGYGKIGKGKRGSGNIQAHILSWQIHRGPVPNGLLVCHRCDVPSCVNPDHLFLGTNKDNIQDCWAKGRGVVGRRYRGRDHHRALAKLTESQAEAILKLKGTGIYGRVIGAEYGVDKHTVYDIWAGKTWAYLQETP